MQAQTTAQNAIGLVEQGLEVHADMVAEDAEHDPSFPNPDADVLRLVRRHGLKLVLGAIHDAAYGAAEVHEDSVTHEDVSPLRAKIFANRLSSALEVLK